MGPHHRRYFIHRFASPFTLNNKLSLLWHTGSLDITDNLKTIKMNMLSSVDCIKAFGKSSFGVTNLCALGKNGDATCQVFGI
jgi:hypothetical protein